jgi:hypothetical protein
MKARHAATRRTTLTLPEATLREAERIARSRQVNLSTVISEVLEQALKERRTRERVEQIMDSYRRSFAGFSEEELMILDGVILEPKAKR